MWPTAKRRPAHLCACVSVGWGLPEPIGGHNLPTVGDDAPHPHWKRAGGWWAAHGVQGARAVQTFGGGQGAQTTPPPSIITHYVHNMGPVFKVH